MLQELLLTTLHSLLVQLSQTFNFVHFLDHSVFLKDLVYSTKYGNIAVLF